MPKFSIDATAEYQFVFTVEAEDAEAAKEKALTLIEDGRCFADANLVSADVEDVSAGE